MVYKQNTIGRRKHQVIKLLKNVSLLKSSSQALLVFENVVILIICRFSSLDPLAQDVREASRECPVYSRASSLPGYQGSLRNAVF